MANGWTRTTPASSPSAQSTSSTASSACCWRTSCLNRCAASSRACSTTCSRWAASCAFPVIPRSSPPIANGWNRSSTTSTPTCRRSRNSSCPAAPPLQPPATSPAPCAGARNGAWSPWPAPRPSISRPRSTSIACPICCSCWRESWPGKRVRARSNGGATGIEMHIAAVCLAACCRRGDDITSSLLLSLRIICWDDGANACILDRVHADKHASRSHRQSKAWHVDASIAVAPADSDQTPPHHLGTIMLQHPVVIIGVGELGSVFARGLLRSGHPVYPLGRGTDLTQAAAAISAPLLVLVAVGEDDLPAVLAEIPPAWRDRLCLLQNELLPRDWQAHALTDPTVIAVWFEKKKGMDSKVLLPSPLHGPRAGALEAALARGPYS